MAVPILGAIAKHKKIAVFAVILLVAGAFWFARSGSPKSVTRTVMAQAQKGTIISSVTGTGQVESSNSFDIKSQVSGTVTAVNATEAQAVKAGQVLAQLDPTDAQAAYDAAAANLENAKLTLQKSQQDNSLSLSQAQDAVVSANNDLDASEENLSKTYEQAFNTVVAVFTDLPAVMSGMDNIINGSDGTVVQSSGTYLNYYLDMTNRYGSVGSNLSTMSNIGTAYTTAKDSYDSVLAEYKNASRYSDANAIAKLVDDSYDAAKKISNATKVLANFIQQYRDIIANNNGTPASFSTTQLNSLNSYASEVNGHLVDLMTTQQSIKSAIQGVDSASTTVGQKIQSLQTLQSLTNPISFQSAQSAVAQKETALNDAADNLSHYTIKAPFDGVISAVDVKVGDSIGAVTVATEISNTEIASITLNEVDAAKVKIGQKATLTFDAIDGLSIVGTVSEVDAVGTVSQGVVNYGVQISLDTMDSRVKPGMSVTAAIDTAVHQDVLYVPTAAVKSSAAGSYVLAPQDTITDSAAASGSAGIVLGQPTKQIAVATGISDDTNTEITSGLKENDWVVLRTVTGAAASGTQSNSILSIFGGGGRGLGGGPAVRTTGGGSSAARTTTSSSTGR